MAIFRTNSSTGFATNAICGQVPDAEAIAIKALLDRIETLEQQVQQLTQQQDS
nr:hypothetical protein [Stenomitos frigidus]